MGKYLKKFETQAAYEAAQSGLILPNVSLTVDNNTVHYNPSTPPAPQSCISAITQYDWEHGGIEKQVETPFCDGGERPSLYFSRPVSFEDLQNLVIVGDVVCDGYEDPQTMIPTINEYDIEWTHPDHPYDGYIAIEKFEGTVNSVRLIGGDHNTRFESIYLE